jgi:hypothetical protein
MAKAPIRIVTTSPGLSGRVQKVVATSQQLVGACRCAHGPRGTDATGEKPENATTGSCGGRFTYLFSCGEPSARRWGQPPSERPDLPEKVRSRALQSQEETHGSQERLRE